MAIKRALFPAQFKAIGDKGQVEAIVSVFGNVDRIGDRVMPLSASRNARVDSSVRVASLWFSLQTRPGIQAESRTTSGVGSTQPRTGWCQRAHSDEDHRT